METRKNAYTCQSQLVSAEARRLLRPGFSGKAVAVLSNTIYLIGERDEVLWVALGGIAGSQAMHLDFPSLALHLPRPTFFHEWQ